MITLLSLALAISLAPEEAQIDKEIYQFENALAPTFQLKNKEQTYNIRDQLQRYNIPAVSVSIIDEGKIAWSHAWGVKVAGSKEQVTADTLFQAASISKPIAAFSVVQLVEAGKLDLDTPINQYLESWQLPENHFTQKTPVTLKHLLSHTAGTTVHGFPGYKVGVPYPTTKQIVTGSGAANTSAVKVDYEPGTNWRYSGGGYTVMQLALEDQLGASFSNIINKLTVKPVGMNNSFFDFILPAEKFSIIAKGHKRNGDMVESGYVVHPESAAASLWTTPTDIAKFSLEMLKAVEGKPEALLSQKSAEKMLTHVKGGYGLGFSLVMDDNKVIGFKHGGSNVGYRAYMITLLDGKGAIVMTNSDNGMKIIEEVLSAAANMYDWPIYKSEVKNWRPASQNEKAKLSGAYAFDFQGRQIRFNITPKGDGYLVESLDNLSPTEFFIEKETEGKTHLFAQMGMAFYFSETEQGEIVMNVWGNQAHRLPTQ